MPNIVPAARYYPKLSEVITVDDLPEFLSFVQDGLDAIFSKIHYKNLQYSKSISGDSAFYSLDIVSKKIAVPLPFDLALVFNSDPDNDNAISSFRITLEYQWEILAFLKSFDLENFSFSLDDFYSLGLKVFRITDEQVLAHIMNNFVAPQSNATKLEQFVTDFNEYLTNNYPDQADDFDEPAELSINTLITAVKETGIPDKELSMIFFGMYVLDTDLNTTKDRLQKFFNVLVPEGIEAYIKKLIIPKAKATLALNAAIEFPTDILKPCTAEGVLTSGKSRFQFAEAELFVDTQEGIGYEFELGGGLVPPYALVGNTGVIIEIDSLKLDLSKDTNIPEADADGRPLSFVGAYARAVSVTLPTKWFKEGMVLQNQPTMTLRLGGYDLLIGSGGISGKFMLEAVPIRNTSGTVYYFDNEINFDYSSLKLLQKDPVTNKFTEVPVANLTELKQKLFPPLTNPETKIPAYSFKFPLKLTEISSQQVKTFQNIADYQSYLTTFHHSSYSESDGIPTLWKKIGSNDTGFDIGFNKFDLTLKQGVVTDSNIAARVRIPKLKNANDRPADIAVVGHLQADGDFNLTASEPAGIKCNLFDVLDITFQSVELGKENGDFYIGADTKIGFPPGSFAASIFDNKEIDLPALRFYANGRFEIAGGTSFIPTNFTLFIGPIGMSVTGIHLGNIQREYNGRMRTYNYIGFDGAMSVDPIGLDIKGSGIKYYYTVDCDEDPLNTADSYVFISTLEVDLVIPGTAKPDDAIAIIKGSITIPEPGVSNEYRGKVSLQLPKANIYGEAALRLNPNDPSFLVEAEVHPPAPIPLGPIGINSFKGLLGLRYVAEKRAIPIPDEQSWYDYYMAPQRGINVDKFSGPELTKEYDNPFSVGVGAAFSSMDGGGRIASLRAMVLLSVPSMFAIDAGLTLLSERLGLAEDDPTTPPFYAFVIIADNSLEFGASAKFRLNKSKGYFLDISAYVAGGFFFKNQKPWYVNFGTPPKPVTAKLFKDVLNVNASAYLMISAAGITAGATATFKFNFIIAKFTASIEVGGFISFERAQVGGYTILKGEIKIKFGPFKLNIRITVHLTVEMPKPFLIYAQFTIKVCARFAFVRICVPAKFTLKWKKNNECAIAPIPPLTYLDSPQTEKDYPKKNQTKNFVKGVNMLTYEEFEIQFFGVGTGMPNPELINHIIPLDTYIDIKVEKGLNPTPLDNKIGGHTGAAKNYIDLIPPKRVIKNKAVRQFRHKYSIETLEIWAWKDAEHDGNGNVISAGTWVTYHPFEAIVPQNNPANVNPGNLKVGFWQRNGKQYDTLRLLATNPFSFLDGAEPGWFIPEQYGITPSELFCTSHEEEWHCSNMLDETLNTVFSQGSQFLDYNFSFNIDGALYSLGGYSLSDAATEYGFSDLIVQNVPNSFNFEKSLVFRNSERFIIMLPEPAVHVILKLNTNSQGVTIKYYKMGINDNSIFPAYELIDTIYKTAAELQNQVEYNNEINYDPLQNVVKIEVIPDFPEAQLIHDLEAQIEELLIGNAETAENGTTGSLMSPSDQLLLEQLTSQLDALKSVGCTASAPAPCDKDELLCGLVETLKSMYNDCFKPLSNETIHQYCNEIKCFEEFIGKIEKFNSEYPEYNLIADHLSALLSSYNERFNELIYQCHQGNQNSSTLENYNNFRDNANEIIKTITHLGDCDCNGDCEKDEILCNFYNTLMSMYADCFKSFTAENIYEYCSELGCFKDFYSLIKDFSYEHPNYNLTNEYIHTEIVTYDAQREQLSFWCSNHVPNEQASELYNNFLENTLNMINKIGELGHCNCGQETSGCDKDPVICEFYNQLSEIYNNCLHPLTIDNIHDYCNEADCINSFVGHIKQFDAVNQSYNLIQNHLTPHYDKLWELMNNLITDCNHPLLSDSTLLEYYNLYLSYAQQTLVILAELGNCNCIDTGGPLNCTTSFQQVCWKTQEHFEYNETIPSQDAVSEDMNAMIAGINVTAQPIWRPNTKYCIKFSLKDLVDDGARPSPLFDYFYGFKTVGPVGHFHKYPGAYTIAPQIEIDGVMVKQIPEEFPLTSISKYIDYERSYPNADGNLILAKPLFYEHDQCKIDIYFAKQFAYHMVTEWQEYHGLKKLTAAMHLAIKDPISGSIIPYPLTATTELDEYVPATILNGDDGWVSSNDPRMPANLQILNNFVNSVNANPDSIECDIQFGDAIRPPSYNYSVTFDALKPRKLYTAIVYNAFDVNSNEQLISEKIHDFVFQTSRYANFREQVNSFKLTEYAEDLIQVINEKDAVYNVELPLNQQQINDAYALVTGTETVTTRAIETQFYHSFDRVLEGILGLKPIDPPITTDFINIVNSMTGETVAVIIRNPEPFNNPRIPLQQIMDTVVFYPKKPLHPGDPLFPDTHYKVLFSKDYSQMIVMHDTKKIAASFLYIMFKYKIWNGLNYIVPDEDNLAPEQKLYSIKTTVRIK